MTGLDWAIVGAYLVAVWAIGLLLARRSTASTEQFFASGRGMPWWLIGTSMAASAFSSDTPHYVARLTREHGVARNWEWWGFGIGGVMVAFVLAPLWRRVGVLTDLEFIETRFPGHTAAALRGVRALHMGLVLNVLGMAAPLAGMLVVMEALGFPLQAMRLEVGAALILATLLYSFFGGFWGVVVTDFLQFVIAMVAAVLLAIYAVSAAGGLGAVLAASPDKTALVDAGSGGEDPWGGGLFAFFVFVGVQWWAYVNADGGGKLVQRMAAAKDERHAYLGTLWFNLTHYALRTWPWVLVGLASILVVPTAAPHLAYAATAVKVLPAGLIGLFVASFVAAYMSTIDTQLNWGASYLVHDFYRRFLVKGKPDTHYVTAGRLFTLVLAAGAVLMLATDDVGVTPYLRRCIQAGMGFGVALLGRWFWWRATALAEIVALIAPVLATIASLAGVIRGPYPLILLITAAFTAALWLLAILLGPRPEPARLLAFYRKARPPGAWGPVAALAPEVVKTGVRGLRGALGALFLVFGTMLGLGGLLLGHPWTCLVALMAAAGGGILLRRAWPAG